MAEVNLRSWPEVSQASEDLQLNSIAAKLEYILAWHARLESRLVLHEHRVAATLPPLCPVPDPPDGPPLYAAAQSPYTAPVYITPPNSHQFSHQNWQQMVQPSYPPANSTRQVRTQPPSQHPRPNSWYPPPPQPPTYDHPLPPGWSPPPPQRPLEFDDMISDFATNGDGKSQSVYYPNDYWESDEYEEDVDVSYMRSDDEKGAGHRSIPTTQPRNCPGQPEHLLSRPNAPADRTLHPPPGQPSCPTTTTMSAVPPPPVAISPPCSPDICGIRLNESDKKWNLDGSLNVSVVISEVADLDESESKAEGQVINFKKPKSTMADDRFLLYTLTFETGDIYSLELYEPQFVDLIALSDITTKCVSDLDRHNSPFILDLPVPVAKLYEGRSSLVLCPFDPGGYASQSFCNLIVAS